MLSFCGDKAEICCVVVNVMVFLFSLAWMVLVWQ